RKIQRQLSRPVRMPPSSTPSAPPPEATKPVTPIAFACSSPAGKRVTTSERPTAEATAPPMPWTARARMSAADEGARAQEGGEAEDEQREPASTTVHQWGLHSSATQSSNGRGRDRHHDADRWCPRSGRVRTAARNARPKGFAHPPTL